MKKYLFLLVLAVLFLAILGNVNAADTNTTENDVNCMTGDENHFLAIWSDSYSITNGIGFYQWNQSSETFDPRINVGAGTFTTSSDLASAISSDGAKILIGTIAYAPDNSIGAAELNGCPNACAQTGAYDLTPTLAPAWTNMSASDVAEHEATGNMMMVYSGTTADGLTKVVNYTETTMSGDTSGYSAPEEVDGSRQASQIRMPDIPSGFATHFYYLVDDDTLRVARYKNAVWANYSIDASGGVREDFLAVRPFNVADNAGILQTNTVCAVVYVTNFNDLTIAAYKDCDFALAPTISTINDSFNGRLGETALVLGTGTGNNILIPFISDADNKLYIESLVLAEKGGDPYFLNGGTQEMGENKTYSNDNKTGSSDASIYMANYANPTVLNSAILSTNIASTYPATLSATVSVPIVNTTCLSNNSNPDGSGGLINSTSYGPTSGNTYFTWECAHTTHNDVVLKGNSTGTPQTSLGGVTLDSSRTDSALYTAAITGWSSATNTSVKTLELPTNGTTKTALFCPTATTASQVTWGCTDAVTATPTEMQVAGGTTKAYTDGGNTYYVNFKYKPASGDSVILFTWNGPHSGGGGGDPPTPEFPMWGIVLAVVVVLAAFFLISKVRRR